VIGYYVHHHGVGHLRRAQALAEELDEPVAGLSSLPCPLGWRGPWVDLPRDDAEPAIGDVTAHQQLHWAPLGSAGLRSRTTAISRWISAAQPRVVVVDVSVEIALLARLHGIPVVSVVLPGQRTDPAHLLGFRASTDLVAMWPAHARGMTPGLPQDVSDRIHHAGMLSRLAVGTAPTGTGGQGRRRVVLLQGRGGAAMTRRTPRELARLTPGWDWRVLGGRGAWNEDVAPVLRSTDLVVTQAGQGSLADVAASRRPAVVIPAARPHDEQVTTARVLACEDVPAVVRGAFPERGWADLLDRAAALDGNRWHAWCDGRAAGRFAELVVSAASCGGSRERRPA
jgi:hypothetical protein